MRSSPPRSSAEISISDGPPASRLSSAFSSAARQMSPGAGTARRLVGLDGLRAPVTPGQEIQDRLHRVVAVRERRRAEGLVLEPGRLDDGAPRLVAAQGAQAEAVVEDRGRLAGQVLEVRQIVLAQTQDDLEPRGSAGRASGCLRARQTADQLGELVAELLALRLGVEGEDASSNWSRIRTGRRRSWPSDQRTAVAKKPLRSLASPPTQSTRARAAACLTPSRQEPTGPRSRSLTRTTIGK